MNGWGFTHSWTLYGIMILVFFVFHHTLAVRFFDRGLLIVSAYYIGTASLASGSFVALVSLFGFGKEEHTVVSFFF